MRIKEVEEQVNYISEKKVLIKHFCLLCLKAVKAKSNSCNVCHHSARMMWQGIQKADLSCLCATF